MINCHLIVPVWGETYIKQFLNICLPSQLSPQNIPHLSQRKNLTYKIITPPHDVALFKKSAIIVRLNKYVHTVIVGAHNIHFNDPDHYKPFSDCYRIGMEQAAKEKAAVILMTADQVWADGSLSNIFKLGDKGFRCILIAGLRVNQATFVPQLKEVIDQSGNTITISSRNLVKIALDHLHPWDRSLYRDQSNCGRPASFFYWEVPQEGLVMRCLHLHPIWVSHTEGYPPFSGTIDGGNFVRKICNSPNDYHIVTDSDEVMHVSIAPPEQSSEWINIPKKNIKQTISWIRTLGIAKHNIDFLKHIIRFHIGDMNDNWHGIECTSDYLINQIIEPFDNPVLLLLMRLYVRVRMNVVLVLKRNSKAYNWAIKCRDYFLIVSKSKK